MAFTVYGMSNTVVPISLLRTASGRILQHADARGVASAAQPAPLAAVHVPRGLHEARRAEVLLR